MLTHKRVVRDTCMIQSRHPPPHNTHSLRTHTSSADTQASCLCHIYDRVTSPTPTSHAHTHLGYPRKQNWHKSELFKSHKCSSHTIHYSHTHYTQTLGTHASRANTRMSCSSHTHDIVTPYIIPTHTTHTPWVPAQAARTRE